MKVLILKSPNDPVINGYDKNILSLSLGVIVSYLRKNNFLVKAYNLNETIFTKMHVLLCSTGINALGESFSQTLFANALMNFGYQCSLLPQS